MKRAFESIEETQDRIRWVREDLGFDASVYFAGPGKSFLIRCSQCEPLNIQGIPCHEKGCPNERHECKGCNAMIPKRQIYCPDCQ
jgi:hypothetical protein